GGGVIRVGDLREPRPLLLANFQVSYVEERRAVRPLVDTRDGRGEVLGRPGWAERRFRWTKAPLQILLGRLTASLADRATACSAATAAEVERDYGLAGVDVLLNVTGGLPEAGGAADEPAAAIAAAEAPEAGALL